ncbi:MAG: 4'-phosphopantetheinyl transferase superfamily protein [Smithella sp.]
MDLQHPANARKSKDFRYLKKILTDAEIEFVRDSGNPDRALWSLWACKETAYKAISKSYAGLSFLPRLWPVTLNQRGGMFDEGKVVISASFTVFFKLFFSEDYVHCIGSINLYDLDKIIWDIESLQELTPDKNLEPSSLVRESLLSRLAGIYQLNFPAMEVRRIKKDGQLQPPYLFYENKKMPFDISLSHDGQYAAYAFISQRG